MSLEQVLLTIAITLLTTIIVLLLAGGVLFYVIVRKVRVVAVNRNGRSPDTAVARSTLAQVQRIAWLMDSSIPVGGGYRIGLDGLIDFVPGLGDVAGVLVSGWIIYQAAACGAPQPILLRMAGNVLLDALLGAFPVLGVIADSAFKANVRNVAIFEEYLNHREQGAQQGTIIVDGKARPSAK
jgi:Domain of unknown function (DUF4112)